MKLKFSLLLICLFCIGLFSEAQTAKKKVIKPAKESNVEEEIPVTVINTKHAHKIPPPPPPVIKKDKPQPPPAPPLVEKVKFAPPVIKKDKPTPPPPPARPGHTKLPVPPSPETPPVPEDIV